MVIFFIIIIHYFVNFKSSLVGVVGVRGIILDPGGNEGIKFEWEIGILVLYIVLSLLISINIKVEIIFKDFFNNKTCKKMTPK